MLLILSVGVLGDVARRIIAGAEPVSRVMIAMTIVAATVNVVSLRLLRGLRRQNVNLRAAWTFSINDFLSNLGMLGLPPSWSPGWTGLGPICLWASPSLWLLRREASRSSRTHG